MDRRARQSTRLLQCRTEIAGPTARREAPAEDRPIEAVEHGGQIRPAVLTTPDRGHVRRPQLVGRGDVERSTLRLGMRTRTRQAIAPKFSRRCTRFRLTT